VRFFFDNCVSIKFVQALSILAQVQGYELVHLTDQFAVGDGQLVDELRLSFTHTKPMPWLLPNVAPTSEKSSLMSWSSPSFGATNSLASASTGTTPTSCAKWVC
jgi:hypothetical protein